jgi:spermidine/putrescine transport system substrate-binding protein
MKLERRDFLKYAGLSMLAMGGPLAYSGSARAAREKELNVLCWEGYNSAAVLDPFRTARDAEVRAESLTNDPTMINRLRGGETNVWDLINVNNPWARDVMYPEKLIQKLDRDRFEGYFDAMLPAFAPPYQWALSADRKDLIGMAQRFGPYSFVVNTDKISRQMAEDQGWNLFNDAAMSGRYGIQETEDWQVFDLCMISGFDPYKMHTDPEKAKFDDTAKRMFKNAALVGDLATMNQALISGEIDAYWPGGTYSCSPARADGNLNIRGVTPKSGPGAGGKGGISWIEITSVVNNPQLSPLATEFLAYVQEPDVSHVVAFAEGTFNPVAQMGNPACFSRFTPEELDIIQWDSLEEEMANSVEYNIVPDYQRLLEIMTAARRT